jgi:quinol monooxygenase YgiN
MNQPPLIIIARIQAKSEQVAVVKAEALKLINPTLKEQGCLQYDMHQDNQDPALFLFYERWATRELWQDHMQNTHLKAFASATEGAIESLSINEILRLTAEE